MNDGTTPDAAPPVALDDWLAGLAGVALHEVSFTLSPRRPCRLESPLASVVRGLLGEALHARLAPEDFARLFEETASAVSARPYWLRGLHLHPGLDLRDRLTVTLSLLGAEGRWLPDFTEALHHALSQVGDSERPPNVVGRPSHREVTLAPPSGEPPAGAVLVTAHSPLSLRGDEDEAARLCPRSPTLGLLLRAGARRLGALQRAVDPSAPHARIAWPDLSELRVREDSLVPWRGSRFAAGQGRRTPLDGLVGDLLVEGPAVGAVLPLLRALERASVGRKTAYGLGWLGVDVVG